MQPQTLIGIKRGLFPTIKTLPNGEIVILPGVGVPTKPADTHGSALPQARPDQSPITPGDNETSLLHTLAAVLGAKDNLPDTVHQAADTFIQAAAQHLSNEHGDDLVIILNRNTNLPGVIKSPGGALPTACSVLVQEIEAMIRFGIPGPRFTAAQWSRIETQLRQCVIERDITQEFANTLIAQYLTYASGGEEPPAQRP
jgi:hypothetical protein